MAYGGASGQHACRLADELGLQSVLFHPLAGVLSAYGMGQARQSCRLQHHVGAQLSPDWLTTLPGQISKLVEQARLRLQQQGDIKKRQRAVPSTCASICVTPVLTNPWPWPALRSRLDGLIQQFQDLHQQRFGYCVMGISSWLWRWSTSRLLPHSNAGPRPPTQRCSPVKVLGNRP